MKKLLTALSLSIIFFGCQSEKGKIYVPREITKNESLNAYQEKNAITINDYETNQNKELNLDPGAEETFNVKFRDTVIRIQTDPAKEDAAIDRFAFAQFVNSQKTCVLVQSADTTEQVAPFYLISFRDEKVEVISLSRPSKGADDKKYTKGLVKAGSSGFMINNDFFVTNVTSKVYLIKRQNPDERIQGDFLMQSPDKQTVVFLTPKSLYQFNYLTNEAFNQPFAIKAPATPAETYEWAKDNFSWKKNKTGNTFLVANPDEDRIVDINEFSVPYKDR
ncbi:hypothetical protein [Pedobacter metabolipauper]|uniref:Uncharacterized protein n=1 Tax=Pedobacter metabolipauper TaxID=425513 RepID=A0A4R6STB8_9SPHI|nr:hypothetical protein [Pedobacter metabolipauper]TDQ08587.1 hypothetical protein ATK78_3103 [Pedobacter metabolipauper]